VRQSRAQRSKAILQPLQLPLLPQNVRNIFSRYVAKNPIAELFFSHCDKKAIERPSEKILKVSILSKGRIFHAEPKR
jgi:hypothetical protein